MDFLSALEAGTVAHGGYQDGRVVDLRGAAHKPLYLIGDIHAKQSRLKWIFEHADLEPQLQRDEAVVVFLGDLFHREERERAGEMDSSLATLRQLMELKIRYPRGLYVLLGNHEFTRTDRCKHGYFQGVLFRLALEREGLGDLYDRFIEASPLVVIHPRCVGVHASPALSVTSLDELKCVPVVDKPAPLLHRALVELTCYRHVKWSPYGEKAYNDYDVDDFLQLCGVPEGPLLTGHTPLDRLTGWEWPMGPRNRVIFAAGRELGYVKATAEGHQLVRVGRSRLEDDDTVVWDRAAGHGLRRLKPEELSAGVTLQPDGVYAFDYPGAAVEIQLEDSIGLSLRHYRHLSAASQDYYALGYYLVGREMRQEVLKLKREHSILVGGRELCQGVRFAWPNDECLIVRQWDEGQFELMALIEGIRLRC